MKVEKPLGSPISKAFFCWETRGRRYVLYDTWCESKTTQADWACASGTCLSRRHSADVGIKTAMKKGNHSSLITYNMYIPIGRLFKEARPETSKSY